MSIAVSALIAPSRSLRAILALFALACFGAAAALVLVLPERFIGAPFCAAIFLLAGLVLLHGCVSATKMHRIDVSGTGTVRLTVQQEVEADTVTPEAKPVTVLPDTLVWSHLLLLHLGDAQGRTTVVPVLRDSTAPADYRALRVALASARGRISPAATTNKIL